MSRGTYNIKLAAAKRRIFQTLKKEGLVIEGVKHRKLISKYFNMFDIQRPIELRWQDVIIKLYEAGELGELEPKKRPTKEVKSDRKKEYYNYLQSVKWKEFRELAFEHFGRKCGLCDSEFDVQLHHKHYRNVFNETFADVIPLCRRCHQKHHGIK
jgi:hypothetical protein